MITQEQLKSLLNYNAETVKFIWIKQKPHGLKVGTKAGSKMLTRYLCIRIDNKLYLCHRLAWLYMTGEWPKNQIDHINGIRDDNRFLNLRDVTQNFNCQIRHHSKFNSKTGLLGVTAETRSGKYIARYKDNYIGTYKTPTDAHEAYIKYRSELLALN